MSLTYPRVKQMDLDEERAVIEAARNGCAASREKVVLSTMHVVYSIARRYKRSHNTLDDLVQEGVLGVLDALDHYDPARGAAFATYASYRVRDYIHASAVGKSTVIQMGRSAARGVQQMLWAIDAHLQQHGRHPTQAETAEALGASVRRVRLQEIGSQYTETAPYDDELGAGIPDDPGRTMDAEAYSQKLADCVARLSDREQVVLNKSYELGDYDYTPLQTIGNEIGVMESRVSQIRTAALGKLKRWMEA